MSDRLEQLQFKLEKILGFRNMQENLENKFVEKPISFTIYSCHKRGTGKGVFAKTKKLIFK